MNKKNSPKTRLYRFFLKNPNYSLPTQVGNTFSLHKNDQEELFHQLQSVLRVETGDQLLFQLPNYQPTPNPEFLFKVVQLNKKQLDLILEETRVNQNFLSNQLNFALALPNKPAKLEFILQKAVELGINQIILIKTEFSNYPHQLKTDRLEKILLEASEQSERSFIPQLQIFESLSSYLHTKPKNLLVALERSSSSQNFLDYQIQSEQTLLIGPEGGFSEQEKELLSSNSQSFLLGNHILRMETAALAALAILYLKAN
ncbi:MAG: 16S rRNA (uracil(1498)-N(3))-methyltransferase [Candidatus Altimarinota bacterium]